MITQDEQFPTTPVAGAPTSLDGRVDTTLVQAGLTSRPIPKLSVRVDARYEDRNDKTPVYRYFPSQNTVGATNDGTNETRDITTSSGKLEATYRLPAHFNVTGGVEYVEKERNSPPVRSVAYREKTDETTVRLEVRRPISETLTGGLGVLHGQRGGSDWLPNTGNMVATTTGDLIAPLHLADRERNTLRFTTNWTPVDPLSINLRVDASKDDYTGRDFNDFALGPREGNARNYALDAGYAFTDSVHASLWGQRNVNTYENAECQSQAVPNANSCTANAANPAWSADLKNIADTFGLTLRTRVTSKLEITADAMRSRVRDEMRLTSITPVPSVVDTGQPLNDIHTVVTTVRLNAKYALRQNMGVRFTYMFDRYDTDDWTWAFWNYSPTEGGTTVRQEPIQKVHFFGVSGYYRWW
jgi:MtrB/PioB family decaheme-associated outer membrane protein